MESSSAVASRDTDFRVWSIFWLWIASHKCQVFNEPMNGSKSQPASKCPKE